MAQYPFGLCEKSIDDSKESSFFCDLCNFWVHTKCNQLRFFDFQHIKVSPESEVIWILQLMLICPTIPLNTHQQRVVLQEPSYILVTT